MLTFCMVGMRVVFGMPLDLRANWIFRITPVQGGLACLRARRRAMLALGVAPVGSHPQSVFLFALALVSGGRTFGGARACRRHAR